MTQARARPLIALSIFVALLFAATSSAAADYATFESFYKAGWSPMWWLAALVALVTAGAIILTGGTASPIVVGIGSWIGGLMGFSGVAATNAGLALLGGGSIASGGFGIVGGTALLTAALTFSTEVVIDYASGAALSVYSYSDFSEASKRMTTLPLPKNEDGPKSYKEALKALEEADEKSAVIADVNQQVIKNAIEALKSNTDKASAGTAQLREQSLLALLSYLGNDYSTAKTVSSSAYDLAERLSQRATLPAFINATALLYDEKPDVALALGRFGYAVTNEVRTPLMPLLFAVFLDRVMYRMNDGSLTIDTLDQVYAISNSLPHKEAKAAVQQGLLARYFIRLKIEQQTVISLAQSGSKKIRDNKTTLADVRRALVNYKTLISSSKSVIEEQYSTVSSSISGRWVKRDWETQWLDRLDGDKQLWAAYDTGTNALESTIRKLEAYQQSLANATQPSTSDEHLQQESPNQTGLWLVASLVIIIGAIAFYWIATRRRGRNE